MTLPISMERPPRNVFVANCCCTCARGAVVIRVVAVRRADPVVASSTQWLSVGVALMAVVAAACAAGPTASTRGTGGAGGAGDHSVASTGGAVGVPGSAPDKGTDGEAPPANAAPDASSRDAAGEATDSQLGTAPSDLSGPDRVDAGAAGDLGAASPDAPAVKPSDDAGTRAELPGWTLVWSDEFDVEGAPDATNWRYETGFVRNQELQWYQPANAIVANGVLTIEAQRQRLPNPNYLAGSGDWKRSRAFAEYTSTSMTTAGKRTFTYGRFEARARIDIRAGSWPAFWTLGTTGGWPAGGEVDIMEFYAGKILANVCRPMGGTCGWSSVTKPVSTLGAGWADQFHIWAMEWDATKIDLFMDGALLNHFNVADAVAAGAANPYVAKPAYILVNLAIGGTNGGDPSNTTFPMKYEVDYVRVYQRAP